jgi:hypothetical protein
MYQKTPPSIHNSVVPPKDTPLIKPDFRCTEIIRY